MFDVIVCVIFFVQGSDGSWQYNPPNPGGYNPYNPLPVKTTIEHRTTMTTPNTSTPTTPTPPTTSTISNTSTTLITSSTCMCSNMPYLDLFFSFIISYSSLFYYLCISIFMFFSAFFCFFLVFFCLLRESEN